MLKRSDVEIKGPSQSIDGEADLLVAAKKIVIESLRARKREHILLVFDNTGRDIAEAFVEAGVALGRPLTAVYVPFSLQEGTRKLSRDSGILQLLGTSHTLITSITDAPETTGFRVSLLKAAVETGLRCVHMPGVNEEIFVSSTLGVLFSALHKHAERVARALTVAKSATIKTISSATGELHTLTMELHRRVGYADGGLARPGKIINIPTGEAFIAPVEGSAEGSICISGSFPECELSEREIVVVFSAGAVDLQRSIIPNDQAGDYCRQLLQTALAGDKAGLRLGELGIGLNPSVAKVNGTTILDEKAFGTAHIALGSNTPFGGKIASPYHHDLVFFPTSVALDQTSVSIEWVSNVGVL